MKSSRLLPLAATLSLASCAQIASTLQEPITSDYNPLDGPSVASNRNKSFQPTGPTYKSGEWVETAMPNSTFFRKIPRGNASADQVLSKGSPLKVISTKGTFLKVETEGGSVGYVPAIMVAEPSSASDTAPFLPPPPSSPLSRSSTDDFAPASVPSAPLNSEGSSLIPAPSGLNESLPLVVVPTSPDRKPSEVLIPTSPPASITPPAAPIGEGVIPPPTGIPGAIEQSIGIE